jgi:hypothetical protein
VEPVYRAVAGAVVLAHVGFLAYVVAGGFLAWRWPRSWPLHALAVGWAALIISLGPRCPLTAAQNWLRARAGQPPLRGGFIDTYVEGVIYPARSTQLVQVVVAVLVAWSWVGCYLRWRRGG